MVSKNYLPGHGDDTTLDSLIITNNPLSVTCGDGYWYSYVPVFTPISSPPSDGEEDGMVKAPMGLSAEAIIALIEILIVIVIIAAAFGVYTYPKRSK